MCGIYLTNIPYSEDTVIKKLASIKFRGPDNTGVLQVGDITLGHLRLSVLDVDSRSNQPMELDGLYITFNGEIYNFQDIKDELMELGNTFKTTSDTEVLLCAYKNWGKNMMQKLNGMFAFCIYDTITQNIFCARDRIGVKPFYYYWEGDKFEICSQLRPLSENKSLCEDAISAYLDCSYIPSPYSIFKNVYKLPPGNYLEIDLNRKKYSVTEYWNLKKIEQRNISYEEAKNELHELLKDAVKIRLKSDVPMGSFLSGGVDSALVSSIAALFADTPINTFSIGFEDPKYDESEIAAKYAEIIGSNHVETICSVGDTVRLIPKLIDVFDEPFADSSALPSLLLNSITTQYVTVALSGDGGDESFLGYNYFDLVLKFKKISKVPFFIRRLISNVLEFTSPKGKFEFLREILRSINIDDFITGIFTGHITLQNKRKTTWFKNYSLFKILAKDPIQKAADLNIKLWLENDSNVKVDRASMAYSVEVRSPFLDYRIIEFARTLPVEYRFYRGKRKKILKDILKEYIPEEVFDQPKKGFSVPMAHWIRNELKQEITDNLRDDFLNIVPNLDVLNFKRMVKLHLSGKRNYAPYIWRLYILSKWYQEFGFFRLATESIQQ